MHKGRIYSTEGTVFFTRIRFIVLREPFLHKGRIAFKVQREGTTSHCIAYVLL